MGTFHGLHVSLACRVCSLNSSLAGGILNILYWFLDYMLEYVQFEILVWLHVLVLAGARTQVPGWSYSIGGLRELGLHTVHSPG